MTANLADRLRSQATLGEWEFHSSLPIFGPVVDFLRRSVHAIAGQWAIRSVIQQQSNVNNRVLDQLDAIDQRIQALDLHFSSQHRASLERVTNAERQLIDLDRSTLTLRHDLAVEQIGTTTNIARLSAKLETIEAQLNGEDRNIYAHISEIRQLLSELQDKIVLADIRQKRTAALVATVSRSQVNGLSDLTSGSSGSDLEIGSPRIEAEASSIDSEPAFDYFQFELVYRGSPEVIRNRHQAYLPYFNTNKLVVDLGCGRGEFLQLLCEAGVPARGVELNQDMVDFCQQRHLPVELADALEYLKGIEDGSLGGVFLGQVVEHLEPAKLVQLIDLSFRKLHPDGCFVAETINPTCLYALTTHYLMDLTHVRPVHPETISFLLRSAGFRDVKIRFSERMPDGARLRRIPDAIGKLAEEKQLHAVLNENIDRLNDFLYGYQDYAALAHKQPRIEEPSNSASSRDVNSVV
jgi:SAM-dependent methyltransferase